MGQLLTASYICLITLVMGEKYMKGSKRKNVAICLDQAGKQAGKETGGENDIMRIKQGKSMNSQRCQ